MKQRQNKAQQQPGGGQQENPATPRQQTNRGGRPRVRQLKPGDRVPLSLRVTPAIREALSNKARDGGRSLTQEAEFRLERSFAQQALLDDVLDLAFGLRVAGFVRLIARVLVDTGPIAAFRKKPDLSAALDWLQSPTALKEAKAAVDLVFDALQPEGDAEMPQEYQDLGERMARGALVAIKDRDAGGELGDWAKPVRDRLGEEIVDRIKVDPRDGMLINAMPLGVYEGGVEAKGRVIDTHLGRSLVEGDKK